MKTILASLALLVGACITTEPGVSGTQSLDVQLITPADPGSPTNRLPDTTKTATVKVSAIDEKNQVDTSFNGSVDVYVQFLGTLTPDLSQPPLMSIPLTNGVSQQVDVPLPPVFGPTVLWIQDGSRKGATYATGTSPQLWFRDPTMADISTPTDEGSIDALQASPLQNKQVTVNTSRYGATGKLVVTSIFAQGYTLSDSNCATTPCTTGNYDHLTIFSFSAPKDVQGRAVQEGEVIDSFAGAVEEFNGLTEIGFPETFVSAATPDVDPARVPVPFVIQKAWLATPIMFERVESALVEIDGGTLCPLDSDYTTYKQWKLDIGNGCGQPINIITSGVSTFDPSTAVGMVIPKVIGTLRPINIGSFNVWIVYPRHADDLQLP